MTAEPTRTINQFRVQNFLGKAAGGCSGALNSFLIVLSDKFRLSATGQYTFDVEELIVRSQARSTAQKHSSRGATDGAAPARSSASECEDRAMKVQREETAFMTLICHDCGAAQIRIRHGLGAPGDPGYTTSTNELPEHDRGFAAPQDRRRYLTPHSLSPPVRLRA